MYTCTHVHMYTSTHLHMYTSTHLHMYRSTPLHMYTSTPLHMYTSTHVHMYTSTHLMLSFLLLCHMKIKLVSGLELPQNLNTCENDVTVEKGNIQWNKDILLCNINKNKMNPLNEKVAGLKMIITNVFTSYLTTILTAAMTTTTTAATATWTDIRRPTYWTRSMQFCGNRRTKNLLVAWFAEKVRNQVSQSSAWDTVSYRVSKWREGCHKNRTPSLKENV